MTGFGDVDGLDMGIDLRRFLRHCRRDDSTFVGVGGDRSNMVWGGAPIEAVFGRGYIDYVVESLPLLPGRYSLTVAVYDRSIQRPYDHWHRMRGFVVLAGEAEVQDGVCYVPGQWRHQLVK